MAQYIDKDALVAEIRSRLLPAVVPHGTHYDDWDRGAENERINILSLINTLEVKEVDLEKEAELIANGIMISVQANKYGTNIYNTERNDFNHHHLQMAARKGIELGLKTYMKGE